MQNELGSIQRTDSKNNSETQIVQKKSEKSMSDRQITVPTDQQAKSQIRMLSSEMMYESPSQAQHSPGISEKDSPFALNAKMNSLSDTKRQTFQRQGDKAFGPLVPLPLLPNSDATHFNVNPKSKDGVVQDLEFEFGENNGRWSPDLAENSDEDAKMRLSMYKSSNIHSKKVS